MNWLLVGVIAVILLMIIRGYQKGFIQMALSIFALFLSIVITGFLGPIFSDSLCGSQIIMDYMTEQVNEGLRVEETLNKTIDLATGQSTAGNTKLTGTMQEMVVRQLGLPESMNVSMLEGAANVVNKAGKVTAKNFADYLCGEIAKLVIQGITYITIFIIVRTILKIVISGCDVVEKCPSIKDLNELAGAFLGGIGGLLVVWVGFLLLLALSSTQIGLQCYQDINKSQILSFLYNNNLLLKWILASV